MRSGALFAPLSVEGGVTLNNLFLLVATATVFLGTFFAVFVQDLTGDAISVEAPYYKIVFVPVVLPLLILAGLGPLTNWRRDLAAPLARRVRWPAIVALAAGVGALIFRGPTKILRALGFGAGVWLIASAKLILLRRWRVGQVGFGQSLKLALATPLAVWAVALAHGGLGVTTLGISGVTAWQADKVLSMSPGQSVALADKTSTLEEARIVRGVNYEANQARFTVLGGLGGRHTLISERRFYPVSQTHTTVAGIGFGALGDVYVSIGDEDAGGGLVVRMWNHPLVGWIWAGGLIMAFGGALSLADRGLRRAVVRRKVGDAVEVSTVTL